MGGLEEYALPTEKRRTLVFFSPKLLRLLWSRLMWSQECFDLLKQNADMPTKSGNETTESSSTPRKYPAPSWTFRLGTSPTVPTRSHVHWKRRVILNNCHGNKTLQQWDENRTGPSQCRFFAGDWSDLTPLSAKLRESPYDIIRTSETIYSTPSLNI